MVFTFIPWDKQCSIFKVSSLIDTDIELLHWRNDKAGEERREED